MLIVLSSAQLLLSLSRGTTPHDFRNVGRDPGSPLIVLISGAYPHDGTGLDRINFACDSVRSTIGMLHNRVVRSTTRASERPSKQLNGIDVGELPQNRIEQMYDPSIPDFESRLVPTARDMYCKV